MEKYNTNAAPNQADRPENIAAKINQITLQGECSYNDRILITQNEVITHTKDFLLYCIYLLNQNNITFMTYADLEGVGAFKPQFYFISDKTYPMSQYIELTKLTRPTISKYIVNYPKAYYINGAAENCACITKEALQSVIDSLKFLYQDDYSRINAALRVFYYLYLNCFKYAEFSKTYTNMSSELGMRRTDFITYCEVLIGLDYFQKSFTGGCFKSGKMSNKYKVNSCLIPMEMRNKIWMRKHIYYEEE